MHSIGPPIAPSSPQHSQPVTERDVWPGRPQLAGRRQGPAVKSEAVSQPAHCVHRAPCRLGDLQTTLATRTGRTRTHRRHDPQPGHIEIPRARRPENGVTRILLSSEIIVWFGMCPSRGKNLSRNMISLMSVQNLVSRNGGHRTIS